MSTNNKNNVNLKMETSHISFVSSFLSRTTKEWWWSMVVKAKLATLIAASPSTIAISMKTAKKIIDKKIRRWLPQIIEQW